MSGKNQWRLTIFSQILGPASRFTSIVPQIDRILNQFVLQFPQVQPLQLGKVDTIAIFSLSLIVNPRIFRLNMDLSI